MDVRGLTFIQGLIQWSYDMKRIVQVNDKIRQTFEAELLRYVEIARQKTGKPIPVFPLVFGQLGGRGGVCHTTFLTGESVVKINSDFLKPATYDRLLKVTLPHEVAHAVQYYLYPYRLPDALNLMIAAMTRKRKWQSEALPHGREWAMIMGWFGIRNPDVRHDMDMTNVERKAPIARPFRYVCRCGEHFLSMQLHKKVQLKGRTRHCKRCKQTIIYERQVGKPVVRPVINLNPVVAEKPPVKPTPPATHRTVTRFVDGMLQNVRIPINQEPKAL